jgi:hypothetical protein
MNDKKEVITNAIFEIVKELEIIDYEYCKNIADNVILKLGVKL